MDPQDLLDTLEDQERRETRVNKEVMVFQVPKVNVDGMVL